MLAVMSTPWVFTGVLLSVEVRADPQGRTSTAADSLFHERHQNCKAHRLQEGSATCCGKCPPTESRSRTTTRPSAGWGPG
jgi:hypothetical protein